MRIIYICIYKHTHIIVISSMEHPIIYYCKKEIMVEDMEDIIPLKLS